MELQSVRKRTALRQFVILEAFRTAGKPMLLSEVAQKTGIPVSTCHGVLKALEQSGYLYFLPTKEAYPTRRLLEMAQEIARHDPLAVRVVPELYKLRDATDETIVLGALRNDHV